MRPGGHPSPAYRRAVAEHLPDAVAVFHRLHVVTLFNERRSDLLRRLHRRATDEQDAGAQGLALTPPTMR